MRIIKTILILFAVIFAGVVGVLFLNKPSGDPPSSLNLGSFKIGADIAQAFIETSSEPDYLPIRDFSVSDPVLSAKAALLLDNRTGRVLFERNSHDHLPIASITKLMTASVVLEKMKLDQTYRVPAKAVNVDEDGADLKAGEELSGSDLFLYMLIPSSNDAAEAFALTASADGFDFVRAMNDRAQNIGMADTNFVNASGLDDEGSYSTAVDVAKLALYSSQYKIIGEALKSQRATIFSVDGKESHQLVSTNSLLNVIPGIVISKTGNTTAALGTMVMIVKINEKDSITGVILNSRDRFGDMQKLVKFAQRAHVWK